MFVWFIVLRAGEKFMFLLNQGLKLSFGWLGKEVFFNPVYRKLKEAEIGYAKAFLLKDCILVTNI